MPEVTRSRARPTPVTISAEASQELSSVRDSVLRAFWQAARGQKTIVPVLLCSERSSASNTSDSSGTAGPPERTAAIASGGDLFADPFVVCPREQASDIGEQVEVQAGAYVGDDEVARFEDSYGRG